LPQTAYIRRRFVRVGDRQVHYLRAGTGSPVVLVHPSPGNATTLAPLVTILSARHTCFAFDTPGFGSSSPISPETTDVFDLSDALAETMRTLGIPKSPIFGTHTGAAVAVGLGLRHPDLVAGLILDGVPIYNEDEQTLFNDKYFTRLETDELGGHFSRIWTRIRDQYIFSPWCRHEPEHLRNIDLVSTEVIHAWTVKFYRAAKTYIAPYRSAISFGSKAVESVSALDVPVVIMAQSIDTLFKHLERVDFKKNQHLLPLGPDPAEKNRAIEHYVEDFDPRNSPPDDRENSRAGTGVEKFYFDLPETQLLVRTSSDATKPAMILLHDAPGSALFLEPLIASFGQHFAVYAPDLPGCGESDALKGAAPAIDDYVESIHQLCVGLKLERFSLYGIGFGASVAIEFARRYPSHARLLALRGVLLPTENERREMRAKFAPPITLGADGGHWYRTWLMLRDSLIYWPWYNRTSAAMRGVAADFSADHLHAWTVEVMKHFESYHHIIDAALAHRADIALGEIDTPVIICRDSTHAFSTYDTALTKLCPAAAAAELPVCDDAHAAFIGDVLHRLKS
jgi:pimeloyl-ACP methyl ester carboxylesterase